MDVPSFRSRFLNIYYSRYQRPAKDYLVANIETMLPLMAKAPKVVNTVISQKWVASLTASTVGYIDTPLMSVPTLSKRVSNKNLQLFDLQYLAGLSSDEKQQHVLIVQDPFTSFYDAEVVDDFVTLAQKLGKTPVLLPFKPNGKAQHIKGFLSRFAKNAKSTADFLSMVAELGVPLVGVDPALVLCYRDEYLEVLGDKRGEFDVLTVHEWLYPRLEEFDVQSSDSEAWYLFAHCTEKTKMPNAEKEWGAIFTHFGATLNTVPVGCCGMAGTFGHEVDKFQMSKDIYGLSWKPRLEDLPKERCLVTGYSCRSQVKRFEGEKLAHPLQVLAKLI